MQANMFTRPEIAAPLRDFVLLELYTDGTDKASEENQALELAKFNTIATPFYAILDPDEKVIATFPGLTKDSQEYLAFLQKGAKPAGGIEAAAAPAGAAPTTTAPAGQAEQGIPQNLKKLDGSELDASVLGGKVVVVNFWATWCVPCVGEIPGFNKLHQEFASKGVVVLGVSLDDGAAQVEAFLKKHPMEYPVALASEAISEKYSSGPIPVTLVFDRSGKQIKRFEGFTPGDALEAAVQQAL
jgi:thiol-disulfide isomerase/thioredoxin